MPRPYKHRRSYGKSDPDWSNMVEDQKKNKTITPKVTAVNGRKTKAQRKLEDGRVMIRCQCKRTRRLVNSATGAKLYCPKCPGFTTRTDQQTTS